jgi:hypothetical protein
MFINNVYSVADLSTELEPTRCGCAAILGARATLFIPTPANQLQLTGSSYPAPAPWLQLSMLKIRATSEAISR